LNDYNPCTLLYSIQHRRKIISIPVKFSSKERDKSLRVNNFENPTVSDVFAQIARLVSKRRQDITCQMAEDDGQ
jgi:hypothetical protein